MGVVSAGGRRCAESDARAVEGGSAEDAGWHLPSSCGLCRRLGSIQRAGRRRVREPARTPPTESRTSAAPTPAPMPAEPQSKPASSAWRRVGRRLGRGMPRAWRMVRAGGGATGGPCEWRGTAVTARASARRRVRGGPAGDTGASGAGTVREAAGAWLIGGRRGVIRQSNRRSGGWPPARVGSRLPGASALLRHGHSSSWADRGQPRQRAVGWAGQQRALLAMLALRAQRDGLGRSADGRAVGRGAAGRARRRWCSCTCRSCASCSRRRGARSPRAGAAMSCASPADAVDAARFERLVGRRRGPRRTPDRAREALALWRGPPLADVADEPFAGARDPPARGAVAARAGSWRSTATLAAGRHGERARRARGARRRASAARAPARPADARALPLRAPGRGAGGLPRTRARAGERGRRRARSRAARPARAILRQDPPRSTRPPAGAAPRRAAPVAAAGARRRSRRTPVGALAAVGGARGGGGLATSASAA